MRRIMGGMADASAAATFLMSAIYGGSGGDGASLGQRTAPVGGADTSGVPAVLQLYYAKKKGRNRDPTLIDAPSVQSPSLLSCPHARVGLTPSDTSPGKTSRPSARRVFVAQSRLTTRPESSSPYRSRVCRRELQGGALQRMRLANAEDELRSPFCQTQDVLLHGHPRGSSKPALTGLRQGA